MEIEAGQKPAEHQGSLSLQLISAITFEQIIFLAIVLIGAIFRFVRLDQIPLSPSEAIEALSVFNYWQPDVYQVTITSPFYFTLTLLLSQIGGLNDAVMRLIPAIFGTGLVVLPWFLRHQIGQIGALIIGAMIAISPLFTLTSRTVSGQSIAIFAAFLAFVAWLRLQESGSARWFFTLAVSLALGLLSSSLFYSFLIGLALAWFVHLMIGPPIITGVQKPRWQVRLPDLGSVRIGIVIFFSTLILGATAFFLVPSGIGAGADLLASWIGQQFQAVSLRSLYEQVSTLIMFDFSILIFGIPALFWATRKGYAFPTLLAYWTVIGFLLMAIQPEHEGIEFVVLLPLYLLIGVVLNDIVGRFSSRFDLVIFSIILIAGAVFFSNLIRFGRLTGFQLTSSGSFHLMLAMTALVLAAIAITMMWSWMERPVFVGLVAAVFAIIFLTNWNLSWWLNHTAANDTRTGLSDTASDEDIRYLVDYVREISWLSTNSNSGLEIISTLDWSNLRWYLRDMENFELVSGQSGIDSSQALITSATDVPTLNGEYIGSDFTILRTETDQRLNFQQYLAWWLFKEAPNVMNKQELIFWLRADLAGVTP